MNRLSNIHHKVALGVFTLALLTVPAMADEVAVQIGAEVVGGPVTAIHVNVDLRDLPPAPAYQKGDPIKEIPRRFYPHPDVEDAPYFSTPDPLAALQAAVVPTRNRAFTTPNLNVDGQAYTGVNPPDTVGDVGPNYYIQAINDGGGSVVQVYNKDGSTAGSSFMMDSLGSGNCGSGYGDPIVLYDRQAGRWFLQEFSQSGNYLCVYISQTSDPISGGWYHYAFAAPNFPDYPHFGVWSDAYYATSNEGNSPPIYAWDRVNMLTGGTARAVQRFTVSGLAGYGFEALTPVDLDGADAPPNGADGILMRHYDDEAHDGGGADPAADKLQLWEIDIDFDAAGNSTLTGPYDIAITEFNSKFDDYSTFYSIPQYGDSAKLDPIREVILNRLQYRNFGDHETLVGVLPTNLEPTSTTAVNGALRWFELRGGQGNWSLYQEGTMDPGVATQNRWVGSISMDQSGNIALAYSWNDTTSDAPTIRYTGRLSNDTLSTMTQPEVQLLTASGSGSGRWGDYASMNVDPTDDCTFWFTTEYQNGGSWATRITNFTFEACGCALSMDPLSISAFNNGDNNIRVSWTDSTTPEMTEYRIFRSLSTGGGYVLLDTVVDTSPGASTGSNYTWDDASVSGGVTYYYVVYASDGSACTSPMSNEASDTATGECLLAPTFGGVTSVSNPGEPTCALDIEWSSGVSECGNGVKYTLWRSTSMGFNPDLTAPLVTGLTGISYHDSDNLTYQVPYYYVVRAIDDANLVNDGNTIEKGGAPTGIITTSDWSDDLESYANMGEAELAGWSHGADTGTDDWSMPTGDDHTTGTGNSFSSADVSDLTDKFIITEPIGIISTTSMTFWHKFDLEDGFDGGVLEISIDGGANWTDLEADITAGGYNDTISTSFSSPIGGQNAWSGTQASFTQVSVNLGAYDGETVNIRWRLACDTSVSAGDWLIDDFYVVDAGTAGPCNTGQSSPIFADGFESGDVSAWSTVGP